MRALLAVLLIAGATACADDRSDALESVSRLASALADGDDRAFIRVVPEDAPNYAELRANVRGLIAQAEVTSSVEVMKAGDGAADLDWYMEIRSRATGTVIERRRGVVHIRFARTKLRAIGPPEFFGPAKVER